MVKKSTRRQFIKKGLATLLVGAGGILYTLGPDLRAIDVTTVRVTLPGLSRPFHGYRIAQISDIHIGTAIKRADLARIVSLINQQTPDLVALTGDFVTYEPESFRADLVDTLGQLRASDGVLSVMGNHDYWTDQQTVRSIISAANVVELSNDVYTVERGNTVLNIGGLDDVWMRKNRIERLLQRMPPTGPGVMLAHEPDIADAVAATGRFGLQMSGHSHGGQVVIPFFGPPIIPPYALKYPLGRYQVGDMVQYTNRGVGTMRLQVRINCRPEVTVFELQSPEVEAG